MTRRCPTLLAVLAAASTIGLGVRPTPARADSITYTLSGSTGLPIPSTDISSPQVVATVTAPGAIVPVKLSDGTDGSPLTILPGSTGFDPSQLVVALKDDTSPGGQAQQDFGLVFFGTGLAANSIVHFALNVNSALASDPSTLRLTTPASGFTLTPDTTDIGNTNTGGGTDGNSTQNVPEPLSLLVWSGLAVTGILRARAIRRGRRREHAASI